MDEIKWNFSSTTSLEIHVSTNDQDIVLFVSGKLNDNLRTFNANSESIDNCSKLSTIEKKGTENVHYRSYYK